MAGIAPTSLITAVAPQQPPGAEVQDSVAGDPAPLFSLFLPQQLMVLPQAAAQQPLAQAAVDPATMELAGKVLPPGMPPLPIPVPAGPEEGDSLPPASRAPLPAVMGPGSVAGQLQQAAGRGEGAPAATPATGTDATDARRAVLQHADMQLQHPSPTSVEGDPAHLPHLRPESQAMVPDAAQARPASPGRPEFHLSQPLTHPGWGDAMAARVSWQAAGGIQEARFHIHPPDLGPVDVRVNVSREQASVQFLTHHVAVRDALEEALPRLRDMLGANGLQLAEASISHQPPQNGHQGGAGAGAGNTGGWRGGFTAGEAVGAPMEGGEPERGVIAVSPPAGLVDAYA